MANVNVNVGDHFEKLSIYTVDLHGTKITVTVTAFPSVVKKWLSTTLLFRRHYVRKNQLVVGLGVQWLPRRRNITAATLQICVGQCCLIFQLAQAESVPERLRRFLNDPNHTFVGFCNKSDNRKVKSSKHELEMFGDPLDLRLYAAKLCNEDLAGASMEEIVKKCVGYELDQSRDIGKSDWSEENLNEDQVGYGCVDAYCAFLIGKNMKAWEFKK